MWYVRTIFYYLIYQDALVLYRCDNCCLLFPLVSTLTEPTLTFADHSQRAGGIAWAAVITVKAINSLDPRLTVHIFVLPDIQHCRRSLLFLGRPVLFFHIPRMVSAL